MERAGPGFQSVSGDCIIEQRQKWELNVVWKKVKKEDGRWIGFQRKGWVKEKWWLKWWGWTWENNNVSKLGHFWDKKGWHSWLWKDIGNTVGFTEQTRVNRHSIQDLSLILPMKTSIEYVSHKCLSMINIFKWEESTGLPLDHYTIENSSIQNRGYSQRMQRTG